MGMVPTLVGGLVRDYFLSGKLGHDWDIEVTHESVAFNKDDWKKLSKALSGLGRVTNLPYEIIRLDLKHHQLEFSPPRKEIFEDQLAGEGHKNFSVEFDFKMPFQFIITICHFSSLLQVSIQR